MSVVLYAASGVTMIVALFAAMGVVVFASILVQRFTAWNAVRRARAIAYRRRGR